MFNSTCNDRGISLIEVVIALFLVAIGMLAVMSLQPNAWRTSTRSDLQGRAAGILQQQLEVQRVLLLNATNLNPTANQNPLVLPPFQVFPGGGQQAAERGDVAFTVNTTIEDLGSNNWRVRVRVTWPSNPNGIFETMIVGRQLSFMWPPL